MTTAELQEQRLSAQQLANANRMSRAADRRGFLRGHRTVSDVVEHPPAHWLTAALYDVLLCAPYFGIYRLQRFNDDAILCGLNVCTSVGGLSADERRWVVSWLRERGL